MRLDLKTTFVSRRIKLIKAAKLMLLLLLLLLKIFKEGCLSATAAIQGALHLNTIHVLKNKFEKKNKNKA